MNVPKKLAELKLTGVDLAVLVAVLQKPQSFTELKRLLSLHDSTLDRSLKRLRKCKLVKKDYVSEIYLPTDNSEKMKEPLFNWLVENGYAKED